MRTVALALASLALSVLGGDAAAPAARNCTFSVAPGLDSLAAAQARVRTLLQTSAATEDEDIVVCLQPGRYTHSAPLEFNQLDSPPRRRSRVVWHSVEPRAALVSGGVAVTGWTEMSYAGGTVYVAAAPAGAPAVVRQLWVANTVATRSRIDPAALLGTLTPWTDASSGAAGFVAQNIPAVLAQDPRMTQALEFVWQSSLQLWIEPRCTVGALDLATRNITLAYPCRKYLLQRADGKLPSPSRIEGVPGIFLSPGMFYHDAATGQLLYALAPGQTPADLESSATIPTQEVLLSYTGVSGQTWNGVAFAFSTWLQPNSPDGFVEAQTAVYLCSPTYTSACNPALGEAEPLGAVRIATSSDITFYGCQFTYLGSAYALSIDRGSQDVLVEACYFHDLSGGFLKLGSIDPTFAGSTNQSRWDRQYLVLNNVAFNLASEFAGAAGLFGGYLFNATILKNSISASSYSAISLGWGWGASEYPGVGANTINSNHIDNVMTQLGDGGGIYVNGHTNPAFPSTMIYNYVEQDNNVFAVYYLDNGASNWHVTRNVAATSPKAWAFFMQGCCNLPAANSSLDHFWYMDTLAPQNNCAASGCVVDQASVYAVPNANAWPAEALQIMNNSGAPSAVLAGLKQQWTQ